MVVESSPACAACGATEVRSLYEVNGFPVVQCGCGLARTVLPAGFDPGAIYTEDYFHGGHKDGYADYLASGEELRHEFRRILAALTRRVSGGRLIDVGCAYGFFLEEAAVAFSTFGVEISEHARGVCHQRGLEVVREVTPEVLAARGPFDAAVMLDVLEHMQDPGAILDLLHAAMRPGAQLVITTGDFGSAIARAMGKHWRLMTPPQHLWFFSPATVTALLERHGFRVHTVEHPWKLVPIALAMYQASRYVGGQELVRRVMPRGRLPINLFDAMRVIAERVDHAALGADHAELGADHAARGGYALACRHARGRVLDLGCGSGAGSHLLAACGSAVDAVVGIDRDAEAIRRAAEHVNGHPVQFACAEPGAYWDRDGFDTVVALTSSTVATSELMIVRAIAALRRDGILITNGALRPVVERYGLRVIDQAAAGSEIALAWRRPA